MEQIAKRLRFEAERALIVAHCMKDKRFRAALWRGAKEITSRIRREVEQMKRKI